MDTRTHTHSHTGARYMVTKSKQNYQRDLLVGQYLLRYMKRKHTRHSSNQTKQWNNNNRINKNETSKNKNVQTEPELILFGL